tara:strand:- start:340 stop:1209 length:870 start_codon:yes stop_codon:yes gene_type:complete
MLRKLNIKKNLNRIYKPIIIINLISNLYSQFNEVNVSFDDRLLKEDEKNSLVNLDDSIIRFFTNSYWTDEFNDLTINLNVQIIFEGNANTGNSKLFLNQSMFSNNKDLHFFDRGSQIIMNQNSSIYYDSVYYDPLASLLGFYGNIILGSEIDTWEKLGGTNQYEKARSIAVRASSSKYSRGWEQRLNLINQLSENIGLRKLRFSTYLVYELFENGEMDSCVKILSQLVNNVKEIFNYNSQENYSNMFLKYHGPKIAEIMNKLGQKNMLKEMQYYDSKRSKIYKDFYSNI